MRGYHKLEASYTIEAAIIVPIILIIFGLLMKAGIEMYQDVVKEAEHLRLIELDAIEIFRNMEWFQNLLN